MARSKFTSISEANTSGSRIETLKALADYLSQQLDECESKKDASSLALRLMKTLEQIEQLEPQKQETAAEKRIREASETEEEATDDE